MAGRRHRTGLDLFSLLDMFPNEESAKDWFENIWWSDGRTCGHCGSTNTNPRKNGKPMPYWCKSCRKYFSIKTGTVMQSSKIPMHKWAFAIYQFATGIKGTSSMKLHRDLDITYKCTWHLSHRVREAWNSKESKQLESRFTGETETDETFIGGKEKNKHSKKKLRAGRGTVGKAVVAGVKNRDTNKVNAKVLPGTASVVIEDFVTDNVEKESTVYTDDAKYYSGLKGLDFEHKSVKHSVGEYVNEMAHTNGMESFWALLKRGYIGTYHKMSPKHLDRFVNEFVGRHNIRRLDTVDQMVAITLAMKGKRLKYNDLVSN
ncbi:MAG: IS1595 family transposase [Gammaproteobacteria bacterium]|nr:IS1595 family transposase [Gammaproteobacteria bacterium]